MNNNKVSQGQITGGFSSLVSLVDYQAGGIVSKTPVDKPSGSVTLFAFAAGQGLSEHTAPFDAMVYVVDGEAEVTHALKAAVKFKMVLTMIKS